MIITWFEGTSNYSCIRLQWEYVGSDSAYNKPQTLAGPQHRIKSIEYCVPRSFPLDAPGFKVFTPSTLNPYPRTFKPRNPKRKPRAPSPKP